MNKTFCDACGGEVAASGCAQPLADIQLKGGAATFKVRAGPALDSAPIPDICRYCVISAIAALDDRPKDYAPTARRPR